MSRCRARATRPYEAPAAGSVTVGKPAWNNLPVTANALFWAFVSITNNETQHVTTITPN